MKEIKQGTIFGFDIVIKVPNELEDSAINENTLENYIKMQVQHELEMKRSEDFLKAITRKREDIR